MSGKRDRRKRAEQERELADLTRFVFDHHPRRGTWPANGPPLPAAVRWLPPAAWEHLPTARQTYRAPVAHDATR